MNSKKPPKQSTMRWVQRQHPDAPVWVNSSNTGVADGRCAATGYRSIGEALSAMKGTTISLIVSEEHEEMFNVLWPAGAQVTISKGCFPGDGRILGRSVFARYMKDRK